VTSFLVNLLKRKVLYGRHAVIYKRIKSSLQKWFFYISIEKLGLKVVTRTNLFKNNNKYCVLPFGSEEKIVVGEPHNGVGEGCVSPS
jgi:hypothetical protein